MPKNQPWASAKKTVEGKWVAAVGQGPPAGGGVFTRTVKVRLMSPVARKLTSVETSFYS